jgi:Cytochrome P450
MTNSGAFDSDPLGWLDALAASGRPVAWMGPRQLCVADAAIARQVLRNDDGLYTEHSDFFTTEAGTFGPRPVQVEIGRRGRAMVERHLREADFGSAVASLAPTSDLSRPLLTGPHRSPRFSRLLDEIVEQGILARGGERRSGWRRRLRRFRFFLAIESEREGWRRRGPDPDQRDLLDLVFDLGRHSRTEQLIEIYLGFVFSLASSAGFALGWSVLLAARHGATGEPPKHIVSEALRLYPVAWLLGRRPRVEHELAGILVGPAEEVVVCPYAVQRSRAHWPDPDQFRPDRWRETRDRSAWLPFGAGEHTCAAVSLTFQILEGLLATLFAGYSLDVLESGGRPGLGAALAPPAYTLRLAPRAERADLAGGLAAARA